MSEWLHPFFDGDMGGAAFGPENMLFVMLLAFAIGHFVGFVYMWTHESISYSRTFVASLAMLPLLIALMMMAMAGSVVVAFGLLAVFGVIRFRNVLKDTRDTVFILWAIMEGLTVGTSRYSMAFMGSLGVAAALLYLRATSFGTRNRYDAVVNLRVTGDLVAGVRALKDLLRKHATKVCLMSQRRISEVGIDYSYQLLLRDASRTEELQAALAKTEGFESVYVFMHDDEAEI